MIHRLIALLLSSALWLFAVQQLAVDDTPIKKTFEERSFTLAYDVFIAAKNFNGALDVAKLGVAHSANKTAWLLKAAKVSLYKSDIAGALYYYKELYKSSGSDEAAAEIARIAPALNDNEGVIMAMQYTLAKKTATKEDAAKLAKLYEDNADVKNGVASMQKLYKTTKNPAFLEIAANMQDRADDVDGAIGTYKILEQNHGLTTELASNMALLLMKKGADDEAYATLKRAKTDNNVSVKFLTLYGELAWRLEKDEDIEYAYDRLLQKKEIKPYELERLIILKAYASKETAAKLAEDDYKLFDSDAMLLRALSLRNAMGDWASIKRILFAIDKNKIKALNKNPSFLLTKAAYYMHEKLYDKAIFKYHEALAISSDRDIMELILSAYTEKGDKKALFAYLKKFEPSLKMSPKYYGTLASAYTVLSMQESARLYYDAAYSKNSSDEQTVSDLSGAYENKYYYSKAQNLKEKLWRTALAQLALGKELNASKAAAQSYVFNNLSADALAQYIAKQTAKDDSGTLNYTYFSYIGALEATIKSANKDNLAKKLLPAWIEMPAQNEVRDFEAVERILNTAGNIPPYDEMEANTWTRRFHQKEELAFDRMTAMDYDDESHRRFSERLYDKAQLVGGGGEYRSQPDIESLRSYLSTTLRPYRTLSIGAKLEKDKNTLHSQTVLKNASYIDTKYSLDVGKEWSDELKTTMKLTRREAIKDQLCLEATHDWVYGRDLTVSLNGGINAPTNETAAVTIGGTKDFVAVSAVQRVSKREFVKLDQEFGSVKAQKGKRLSYVSKTLLTLGYQARTEYPDINVRLYYGFNRYNNRALEPTDFTEWESMVAPEFTTADVTMALLMPQTYGQYGMDVSWGESITTKNAYSKAFRPYGLISLSTNTRYGYGYGFVGGFVTSLEGKDRLQTYITYGQGGQGSFLTNGINKGIGFSYLLRF